MFCDLLLLQNLNSTAGSCTQIHLENESGSLLGNTMHTDTYVLQDQF